MNPCPEHVLAELRRNLPQYLDGGDKEWQPSLPRGDAGEDDPCGPLVTQWYAGGPPQVWFAQVLGGARAYRNGPTKFGFNRAAVQLIVTGDALKDGPVTLVELNAEGAHIDVVAAAARAGRAVFRLADLQYPPGFVWSAGVNGSGIDLFQLHQHGRALVLTNMAVSVWNLNIARAVGWGVEQPPPDAVVRAWMRNPSHWMQDRYTFCFGFT